VIVGLLLAIGTLVFLSVPAEGRPWFAGVVVVLVVLPLLATGLIVLLHRVGLIDDEAAERMGVLHALGLLMFPVMGFMVLNPGSPVSYLAIPVLILSFFGFDVLQAIGFKLGLTKRRSLSGRVRGKRREPRPSALSDPGRYAAAIAVDAHLRVLQLTERKHYGPGQAVGRLFLIATLPMFMVGVFGLLFAVGGVDGTPLIVIGLVGGVVCLAMGLLLGLSDDGGDAR
jgi:hypothetical protein